MAALTDGEELASPIPRLTSDILLDVFMRYSKIHRSSLEIGPDSSRWSRRFKDKTVNLTHVCRYWQSVAIDFPPLWAFIHVPSFTIPQIDEYIARSKDANISLYLTLSNLPTMTESGRKAYNKSVFDRIKNVLGQIRFFRLSDLRDKDMRDFTNSILQSTYNLDSLSISQYYRAIIAYGHDRQSPSKPEIVPLPSHLSTLSELILVGVVLGPEIPQFKNLSRFVLMDAKVTLKNIVEILAGCSQCLTHLELKNLELPHYDSEPELAPQKGRIRLEKLRRMDIDMLSCTAVDEMLSKHIEIPDMRQVAYRSCLDMAAHIEPEMFGDFLIRHFNNIDIVENEMTITVDSKTDRISLQAKNFLENYYFKPYFENHVSLLWELSVDVYTSMCLIMAPPALRSLKLVFPDVDSRPFLKHEGQTIHPPPPDEPPPTGMEYYTDDLEALRKFILKANFLQCISITLPCSSFQSMIYQNRVLAVLNSICFPSVEEDRFPNLHLVDLQQFNFNFKSAKELGAFTTVLSKWNQPRTILQFSEHRYLKEEIRNKIKSMVDNVSFVPDDFQKKP